MDVLQRRMEANLQRLQREGRLAPAAAGPKPSAPPNPQETRKSLSKRLKALDASDARFTEHAADAFVESVLLAEFGETFTNDANFRQVILQVSRDMRDDPDTAQRLGELFSELRTK